MGQAAAPFFEPLTDRFRALIEVSSSFKHPQVRHGSPGTPQNSFISFVARPCFRKLPALTLKLIELQDDFARKLLRRRLKMLPVAIVKLPTSIKDVPRRRLGPCEESPDKRFRI